MTILITDQECERLVSLQSAIPAIEEVFRMAGMGEVENPPRFRMPSAGGTEFQFGAAKLHARNIMGYKVGSPQTRRWIYLYGIEPNDLIAVIQAKMLSRLRTAATSAVAVRYLSPATASVAGLYGTGRQAVTQLEAICAVRPIKQAVVYSRNEARRTAFARTMADQLGIEVIPARAPEEVASKADILVTITNSTTPVLLGEWVSRPCLVLCVGANHTYEREIDAALVRQAMLVVVDDRGTARAESGELLYAAAHGLLKWGKVEELGKIVAGRTHLPDISSGIVLFESHGLAMQDVAIGALTYELAQAQGMGSPIVL